jgi:hypothetical protein
MKTVCTFCGKKMRNKPIAIVRYDVCRCCKHKAQVRWKQLQAMKQKEPKACR